MTFKKTDKGFTLLELLIASAIFAVVMVSLTMAFRTGLFGYQDIEETLAVQREARQVMGRIYLDLRNSIAYSRLDSMFSGERQTMRFLTIVDTFGSNGWDQHYAYVVYHWDGRKLTRSCSEGVDSLSHKPSAQPRQMTDQARDFSIEYGRFFPKTGEFLFWEKWDNREEMPEIVKLKLTFNDLKQYEKLVALPLGSVDISAVNQE